jgi:hypothetical protein
MFHVSGKSNKDLMKRSVCQCGVGDAITMSTSPVYLNASPQEGVGTGQGVGVGVKVCSTGCRSSCEFGERAGGLELEA